MQYHWSPNGSDAGAGTLLDPWQTVAKFNSEALAGTFNPGDVFAWEGGNDYSDTELQVSLVGTGALNGGYVFMSYGAGRATFKSTVTGRKTVLLSGAQYVTFQNINFEHLVGAALGANDNCVDMAGCTAISFVNVETLGGRDSFQGANTTASYQHVTARFPWEDGFSIFGTGQHNVNDIEVYAAGFDQSFTINSDIAAGDGLSAHDSAYFRGKDVRLIRCKTPITNINTSGTSDLQRVWILIDHNDQETAVAQDGGGTTFLRDSMIRVISSYVPSGAYGVFGVTTGGTVELDNVTVDMVANGTSVVGIFSTSGSSTLRHRNCNFSISGPNPNRIIGLRGSAGDTVVGTTNNVWIPGITNPFVDIATPLSVSAWAALYEPSLLNVNPLYENLSIPGPEGLKVSAASPLIGAGTDLSVDYALAGLQAVDYFGFGRLVGAWSIGGHEFPIPTIQSFLEGGGEAVLDAGVDVESYASIRSIPPFQGFPAISHKIESTVRFSHGMRYVGIWGMGGPAGGQVLPPAQPISTQIYQHSFAAGAQQPLEDGGIWDLGLTPGTNDPRRVLFELRGAGSSGNQIEGRLRITAPGGTNGISISSNTGNLTAVYPQVQFNTDLKMTLEFIYIGRQPGPGNRNDYVYTIRALVEDLLVTELPNIVIPQGYVEGFGIPDVSGPAVWAGITGERSTFSGNAPGSTALVSWKTFGGLIQGSVSPLPIPSSGAGEARDKAYLAKRGSAMNRTRNGGFTSFPKGIRVQRLEGAVEVVDPTYVPPTPEIPIHIVIMINGSDSMNGGETIRTESFLEQMVRNLPTDGSIMLTVLSHRNTSGGLYGNIFPNVAVFIPTKVVTPATLPTIIAECALFNAGNGQERWASALDAALQLFNQGVSVGGSTFQGGSKMCLVIDDEGDGDIGIRRSYAAAEIDAIHALPGLVECGILSVNFGVDLVVGNGLNSGSWDFIFPRPDTPGPVPNTPLVDPNFATTDYISTVAVPNTQGALCARTFKFLNPITGAGQPNGGYFPPDLPIIQNPPLQPLTHWPSNAGSYFVYAEWCGYTWAQQIVKRRDEYLLTAIPPGPPPTIQKDAFQAWPDLDGGYAFDVPSEEPAESLLGEWFIHGAAGSIEIAPRDANDAVIPSRDGGNLARITFGASGTVWMRQAIVDVKPFRGQTLTVAYSGRRFTGRVGVTIFARIDGEDHSIDVAFSQSFGEYTRRTATYAVPINAKTIEIVFKFTGNVSDSVGLSGLKIALGSYALDLPYSDSIIDSVIPSGAVVMATGAVCPPGFRRVPDSKGRLAYATTGDPNFVERAFIQADPASSGSEETFVGEVDLVFLIDISASQWGVAAKQTVLTWLQTMMIGELPRDGRVNVGIVAAANNIPTGSEILLPLTPLTIESASGTIQSAIDQLATLSPGNDFTERGIIAAKTMLEAGEARWRMLFRNTDGGGYGFNVTQLALTEFANILTLPRFIDSSAVVVNSTRAAVLAQNGENFIFPVPSSTPPGILFAATGGTPGSALPNAFNGQPYQAGVYAAEVLGSRVVEQVQFGITLSLDAVGDGVLSRTGGQRVHDHGTGSPIGSSTDESDGFEPAATERAETISPIPIREQASIKPYPFNVFPQYSRPEDPPVLAIGPAHAHSVRTDMEALPPAFPVLYCEKL